MNASAIRAVLIVAITICLVACGGDSESQSSPAVETTQTPLTEPGTVTSQNEALERVNLQGTITYDRVPFGEQSYSGLNYSAMQVLPARGVVVQAEASDGELLASTVTDELGFYQFDLPVQTDVRVRVPAQLQKAQAASWNIQVKDNTRGNALYVLEGGLHSTGGAATQIRDLHAPSGWTGSDYGADRTAAPYAILDTLFDALSAVEAVEPNVTMPPLSVFWSTRNIAIGGSPADGRIGTSYYTSYGPSIYLLGTANNDSDEYDRAVIAHEFGHYLEHQLGRSESVGGAHSQASRLDMRVAFGEAWGNAFAAIAGNDPVYRDSLGSRQGLGFSINVETKPYANGWYSEATIQALLYDLFDSANDDSLDLGFAPIFKTLTDAQYLQFPGFASIFLFNSRLQALYPEHAEAVQGLVNAFGIYGSGPWAEGEINAAGSYVTLPVYRELSAGVATIACSDSDFQEYNGVDVRRYLRMKVPHSGVWSIDAVRSNGGLQTTNPQMRLYQAGNLLTVGLSATANTETMEAFLLPGEFVVELYEHSNADLSHTTGGLACFEVSLRQH